MMHSMHAQGAPGGGMNMQGTQPDHASAPGMACDCAGCAARAGFAALLGQGAGALTLTAEQATALAAITARAREAALAALTGEQRAALEARATESEGGCMNARTAAEAEQPH